MERRVIPQKVIDQILQNPQQIVEEYGNKKAFQSIIDLGAGKEYLVRIIVDDTVEPAKIVTVYRTSKISKYWRQP